MKAENQRQPDSHVRISRKIEKDLKRIGNRPYPRRQHIKIRNGQRKHFVGNRAHRIGYQHFFSQADNKPLKTSDCFVRRFRSAVDLIGNIVIFDNRSRNQRREQSDIQPQLQQIALRAYFAAINVNNIRHRLKRIKRNADGQNDFQQVKVRSERFVDVFDNEIRILEVKQKRQIQYQRYGDRRFFAAHPFDAQRTCPVQQNRSQHNRQIARFAPAVKNNAGEQQPPVAVFFFQQKINGAHHRQKHENKSHG